jgi:outer membrane protein OmpA-like peptidoglycan-associated protein
MKNWIVTIIILSSFAIDISAQKTTQWASTIVRYSSQPSKFSEPKEKSEFCSAKQALGAPNAVSGFSISQYSWSPETANSNRDEFLHVEFGIPMKVRQFAIVESLNPGAIRRVDLIDTRGKFHKVYEASSLRPAYTPMRVFSKKIPVTDYKVVGLKVYLKTSAIKGFNQIDAIAISNNNDQIKSKVNTLVYSEGVDRAENLGTLVNSKYSERVPIISPDGNLLYFTRKFHPENLGEENKDDIWVARKNYSDDKWEGTRNIGQPLNNKRHNFVIAVSPDNERLYLSSSYKGSPKDGVSVARRRGNSWSTPVNLNIENMYNKSPYAGYHVSMDGNIILMAVKRDDSKGDRDIYVSFKQRGNKWSEPKNLGKIINTVGMENSVFLAADNRTIYFSSNGFAGYGGLDMYMSRRLDDSWENWSEPQNLGRDINTPGNDYNYTIPASGDYAYFSSDFMSNGQSDLFRIQLPKEARPDPVMLIDNDIVEDFEEELDGDIVVVNDDPILQKEVDNLKERLKRLNEELTQIEERETEPSDRVEVPRDKPTTYDKPTYRKPTYDKPKTRTTTTTTTKKSDPELERLKNKYNRHLDDDYDETEPKTRTTTTTMTTKKRNSTSSNARTSRKTDDENEALKRRLRILNGEEVEEDETIVEVPETPETPDVPERQPVKRTTPTANANANAEALKEETRQRLKEELRSDVKSELKRDMIDDVREDLEDEMRIDLEDDLKQKVEDELKATLEDEVKADLKKKLQSDVEDDLRNELTDEVRVEVEKELREELEEEVKRELRNQMEYRIKKEMETQIRRELEAKIRAQLEEEYADKLKNTEEPPVEEEDVVIVPLKVGEIIPMNNIFFDANEMTLKTASNNELNKVLAFLNQHPNLIVEIGGHTNSWCSHEFANQLSDGRAKAVREFLISKGVAATRILSHGYGKTKPIADNKTVNGRKKNQRVEMKIVKIVD